MKRSLSPIFIIIAFSLAGLAGLMIGANWAWPGFGWLAVTVLSATCLSRRTRPLALVLLALAIGWARGAGIAHSDALIKAQFGRTITVVGRVSDDPALDDNDRLRYDVETISINGHGQSVLISIYGLRQSLHRGYQVELSGRLRPGLGAAVAEMSFPKVIVISDHLGWLEQQRLKFFAATRSALPEPLGSFALGLLIGARSLIPKALQTQLATVGLSHLVAVSGYNLTIIVMAARRLLERLGKFVTLAASIWLIAVFVAVAGASASIVRAAVVSLLALAAAYYGRSFNPWALISLVALITAIINPHSLKDVGWQLSFAAFGGILILAPALAVRTVREPPGALLLAFESVAAYLATLPIILLNFGTISPIAPLINLVVMPLVPITMLLSFMAGLATWWLAPIAGWLAWPAAVILKFMLGLIDLAARVQPVKVSMSPGLAWFWLGLLAALALFLNRQPRPGIMGEREDRDVRTLEMA